MSKSDSLKKFREELKKLRLYAKEANISDAEVDSIFQNGLISLQKSKLATLPNSNVNNNGKMKSFISFTKYFLILSLFMVVIYILLNVHQPTSSIVLRNVQGLIHPGFKIIRFFSVPLIEMFPMLTTLYDESCLVENPYFYVADMECWPCENVHSVVDLTGFNNFTLHKSGVPYIVKSKQKYISVKDLQNMYEANKDVFDRDAKYIKSNSYMNLSEFFESNVSAIDHFSWRINRMKPARLLRSLFPKPDIVSDWTGQSMERYVMIDGSKSFPYTYPNFECSYIFVIQSSGIRTIILKPSKECGEHCKTISVVLRPSYVLWYNWWYWRPISLPNENETDISISYISSYC